MSGDSSEMASATSGIAVIKHPSQITSGFLSSRARVAKQGVAMPRLELVANHMNVNMGYNISKALRDVVEIQQVYMWTDFQVALHWITNPQLSWKQFVSNRVQKINEKGEEMNVKWLYCPTEESPVDIATRGCQSSDLGNKWWVGPSWPLDKSKWPDQPDIKPSKLSEEERKQIKETHLFTVEKPDDNLSRLM